MKTFTPSSWYWSVAPTAQTQVYSSAAVGYVPLADPTYAAFLSAGNKPTVIDTEQNLWDVLIAAGVSVPAGNGSSATLKAQAINAVALVVFQVLFNHENRIRTLESKATITVAQFRAGIASLLP